MISVIIPCHSTPEKADGVSKELWFTVASIISVLEHSEIEYEIIVVLNGAYPVVASLLHEQGRAKAIFAGPAYESPQAARHLGLERTSGDVVFFLDAHVVIPPDFFRQVLSDMDEVGADFMGTGHRWLGPTWYGAKVAWDEYLWSHETTSVQPCGNGKLWRAALHPHGAFAVRRESYDRAGGYWQALKGFGGEESQLCFKFWMMGLSCWVTPRTYHWHYLLPGGRRDGSLFRDENFARNFLLVAAAYGGDEQFERSYNSMKILHWANEEPFPMMRQQVLCGKELRAEREMIAREAKYKSLAELREFFNETGVMN